MRGDYLGQSLSIVANFTCSNHDRAEEGDLTCAISREGGYGKTFSQPGLAVLCACSNSLSWDDSCVSVIRNYMRLVPYREIDGVRDEARLAGVIMQAHSGVNHCG